MENDRLTDRDKEESRDTNQKSGCRTQPASLSRRTTLTSLLGVGGFGLLGANSAQGAENSPQPRPWNQDVDAQGHQLSDLGALSLQANTTAISHFEGQALSIDNNGVLNVTASGIWQSGDLIPLLSYNLLIRRSQVYTTRTTYGPWGFTRDPLDHVVPFGSLSFDNIPQLYVSMSGLSRGDPGGKTFLRLYDVTNNSPVSDSEVQITNTGKEVEDLIPFDGPKAAYNANKPVFFQPHLKSGSGNLVGITGLSLHIWGEIAE